MSALFLVEKAELKLGTSLTLFTVLALLTSGLVTDSLPPPSSVFS